MVPGILTKIFLKASDIKEVLFLLLFEETCLNL